MPIDLKIGKLVNRTVWDPDRNQVLIDQTLELECDCGSIVIIEQHIDGMTMIEGVRHSISAGKNTLDLKQMRIVNPRTVRPDGEPSLYALDHGHAVDVLFDDDDGAAVALEFERLVDEDLVPVRLPG